MSYFKARRKDTKFIPPPSWSTGTDAEITKALEDHYAGKIDLTNYWAVGDERTIHLSTMSATGVGESHVEQDAVFVIMNVDNGVNAVSNPNYNYQLVTPINGHTRPAFIVGMKNLLANGTTVEHGYMNSTQTNAGGWESCARRTWCNSVYYNALPTKFKNILKQVRVKAMNNGNQSGAALVESNDYVFLAAATEVFKGDSMYGQGSSQGQQTAYAHLAEYNALSRWDYYATTSNRIKTARNSGSAYPWWERSPYYSNSTYFCFVNSSSSAGNYNASSTRGLAPACCI